VIGVSAAFDAGAIDVPPDAFAGPPGAIRLEIRRDATSDPACAFRQWFYFRVQGARAVPLAIELANAGACTYPDGWPGYRAVASYDREDWFRVPTRYADGRLHIEHCPERDSVYYAYFEPYSWERHLGLLGRVERSPHARVTRLGASVEGRDLDLVTIGEPVPGRKRVWVIARQHPGETMAEWFVDGLLARLLDAHDGLARAALERAVWYVVPNMNPDGSVRGNLRANAAGANLNREWAAPSVERSPEVWHVRAAMHARGVDSFLDVHGDEGLPYVFVAGGDSLPGFTPEHAAAQARFGESFRRASPDFQTERGYGLGKFGPEALKLASKYVGHEFGCLALTLEMPFKDNANAPDERAGWSGARSARLGAAALQPLAEHVAAIG
jgi:murein tripeptide amidase MpaA